MTTETEATDNEVPVTATLTLEDREVLERFMVALRDGGVRQCLTLVTLQEGQDAVRVLEEAMRSVRGAGCLPALSSVAPSVCIVVDVAREAGIFPDDFLPSEEVVGELMFSFWENIRLHPTT